MPIRINLLAEAQAAEEARRRDPVKRAISVAGILIGGMLLWGGFEFWLTHMAKRENDRQEKTWKTMEAEFNTLTKRKKEVEDRQRKIDSLVKMSTNRFLWGTTLNGFQQTAVDQVQFIRLTGTQGFARKEEPVPSKDGKRLPPKIRASETAVLTIEAKDYGNPSQQNYNDLKKAIYNVSYFRTNLLSDDTIRLKTLNNQPAVDAEGRAFSTFILEVRFPDKIRDE